MKSQIPQSAPRHKGEAILKELAGGFWKRFKTTDLGLGNRQCGRRAEHSIMKGWGGGGEGDTSAACGGECDGRKPLGIGDDQEICRVERNGILGSSGWPEGGEAPRRKQGEMGKGMGEGRRGARTTGRQGPH
jgi:hypothetical protein